jgi:hypothetical protein
MPHPIAHQRSNRLNEAQSAAPRFNRLGRAICWPRSIRSGSKDAGNKGRDHTHARSGPARITNPKPSRLPTAERLWLGLNSCSVLDTAYQVSDRQPSEPP